MKKIEVITQSSIYTFKELFEAQRFMLDRGLFDRLDHVSEANGKRFYYCK